MKKLRIAEELTLPLDAVTQTMAAIGRKGAGKTYLATLIAEQMLDAEAQIIVIDPVGNWWGLRVAADGRSKGKNIFVIGGEHGDVPLVPEAGAKIARLLVEKRISAVLDISGFRQGERKRFAADFGEEFFHLKKTQRSPVHVFVEEAQLFAPQRPGPDEARMLGAFENIIRLGRNYGIGATLITQRPQSVNKEVLSQVECLCVLQVNGTHERKALEDWVQEAGADRKLVGELPGLSRGEGFVWSPSWLRIYQRVHFSQKTTFDASATPEVGKAAKAATLSSIDVDALRADLQEVVAQAEKDDPKALRKEIAELKRELAKKPVAKAEQAAPTRPDPVAIAKIIHEEVEQVVRNVIRPQMVKAFGSTYRSAIDRMHALAATCETNLEILTNEEHWKMITISNSAKKAIAGVEMVASPESVHKTPVPLRTAAPALHKPAPARIKPNGHAPSSDLPKGERAILIVCAQYEDGATKDQLTVMTGYKRSSRDTYIQRLREKGFVAEQSGNVIATEGGIVALGDDYEPLPEGKELQDYWLQKLPEGERRILELLIDMNGEAIRREDLDEPTGYKRSSRDTYLQRLSSRRLIDVVGKGEVRASQELFA